MTTLLGMSKVGTLYGNLSREQSRASTMGHSCPYMVLPRGGSLELLSLSMNFIPAAFHILAPAVHSFLEIGVILQHGAKQ